MHLNWLTKELLCWSFWNLLLHVLCRMCSFAGKPGRAACSLVCFFQPGISWSNLVIQQWACFMIILKACVGQKVRWGNWSGYCLRASVQSTRGCSGWWPWWEMPDQYRRPCCPSHAWMRWEVLKCPAKWNWDCIRCCWLLALVGDIHIWGRPTLWAQKRNSVRIQSEQFSYYLFADVGGGRLPALLTRLFLKIVIMRCVRIVLIMVMTKGKRLTISVAVLTLNDLLRCIV